MSSSMSTLSEEIQCSICLEVFTDPVTTPCGHNFCKICLNKCWDNSQTCSCPYCNETFKQRPDLKINTTLREIVGHYKTKSPEKKPEVLCDICEERKLKALKSCLVCQSSYCETHLEPHLRVAGLKKHKLMDPVSNLEDYICQKHERPLDLFCRDDQTCVCSICTVTDHKNHNTVAIEEESQEKKTELMKTQKDVQQMIQDRIKKIQDIKHSAEVRKRNTEKGKAVHVELFTDLIRSIERHQTELLEMMEEQQKAAEKQEQELIEELEQEITELKMRNTELEQLSHTEDHLHLLQIHSSLCSPRNTRNWPEISMKTHESLETLRRALTQLKDTIDEKLTLTVSTELKWMQQYAVDVTLDPDTTRPKLILSEDAKQPSGLSGPHNLGQGQREKEQQKISASVSLTEDLKLNKAEKVTDTVWRSGRADNPEFLKTQELFKCMQSILNKLTPQMFQPLMRKVSELTIDTEERLKGVVELIFEKAISEPNFSVTYANMCRCLIRLEVPTSDKPGMTVNFRKLLLNRCQKKFEKDKDDDKTFENKQKELDAATGEEEKQRLKEELEDAKDKALRRSLGNIKFIGELFKLKMLTEDIMYICIIKLLKNHDEENLECLCCLLSTIGKDLNFQKAKPQMDQYFNQMEKIIKERKTSSRIRFMLQDFLDLRRVNHQNSAPDDGWETVPISTKNRPIDTTRLSKITKPDAWDFNNQFTKNLPGGKGSWGSWGKGSSRGSGSKPSDSTQDSGRTSTLNRFSALQQPSYSSSSSATKIDSDRRVPYRSSSGPEHSLRFIRGDERMDCVGDRYNRRNDLGFDRMDWIRPTVGKHRFSREKEEKGLEREMLWRERDREHVKRESVPNPPPFSSKPALTVEEMEKKSTAIIEGVEFTLGEECVRKSSKVTLSPEDISRELERLLKEKADNQRIFDWVEANLDEQQTSLHTFIRPLMTAVCQSAIICENPYKLDTEEMTQRAELLQRYIKDEQKELQALYALQSLMVQMEQPPNLLRMFFDVLYDEDVIKEDGFFRWESSKDPAEQQGKGVALKSVRAFFTWLREAEDESDNS
ncbi:eukaryotic translation initiation factor 4 gamma 1-like isoform X3 [Carassius auratus]|uniref:RING-type E3 ubiquitin transferase n=1 Tax=Carassius auratus TaxID=7957 RepID=A0A6P6LDX5_CARAU|nr:eukaryotic translation initiation factor 4 gamma 1-like isoform X3 [Carassius auratus]